CEQPLPVPHDFIVDKYHVHKRPHVAEFIDFCRARFRMAVWTSATEDYAIAMVDELFGAPHDLAFLWHREQCITQMDSSYEPVYIKDLKKVKRKGFDLDQVIALDDSPEKLQRNYGNLLRIAPFYGDPADDLLLHVMPFLDQLRVADNIRAVEKRGWSHKT
ncbi:MAG: HAD family hydrolase, partial [Mariprofundaceae bacterium]|nr:HAD family hydrolase [Mariprofundaceae bacterium]